MSVTASHSKQTAVRATGKSKAKAPKLIPNRGSIAPEQDDDVADAQAVLNAILDLEEIDSNLFRGYCPDRPRWGRVYGGQTVSQALVAASRTVPPPYVVHSLHAYFLFPGDDLKPILYQVIRVRDTGKSFLTRNVVGSQQGRPIFTCTVSFHRPEPGFSHQADMPEVPAPETLPTLNSLYRKWGNDPRVPSKLRVSMLKSAETPFPMDIRFCETRDVNTEVPPKLAPKQRQWMRTNGRLQSDDFNLHACAAAYLSDWSLLRTSVLPHGFHHFDPKLQLASLDHTMWFHAPFRADEWLLYDMFSPRSTSARGLSFGHFFTREGVLVVSVAQEGLARVRVPRGIEDKTPPPPIRSDKAKGAAASGEEAKEKQLQSKL